MALHRLKFASNLFFKSNARMASYLSVDPSTRTLYDRMHSRSVENPTEFWADAAEKLSWFKKWDKVLDDSKAPMYSWFDGGLMNVCYNAVDRHVEQGRGDQAALIYDSAMTGTVDTVTYKELQEQVARFAGALEASGVEAGDRVLIYMPMIPEAAVAMLACARIGAVHSVVFGGFAPKEVATRIDDSLPKVVVSASCGLEPQRVVPYKPLLDEALELSAHKPDKCIVLQREGQEQAELKEGRDVSYADAMADAPLAACAHLPSSHPLYILYTSGTTGQPKGVVRDSGGYATALQWSMEHFYNVPPGEVFWTASDIGWVVGHSYTVYAPLINGNTTVMYEGKPVGTPDAGAFWRVIEQHKVHSLFTAPTALRSIRAADPEAELLKNYDLSNFKTLWLAGERADPGTLNFYSDQLQRPVLDHWWQTETGWPMCGNPLGTGLQPVKPGSSCLPVCGYDVRVLSERGEEVGAGESGSLAVRLPMPPGTLPTLYNNDERYIKTYLTDFPGYYRTGDSGFKDEDGYVHIMCREDDVINVAGHRLSTGQMEEVLMQHSAVAEAAVVGCEDALKGELPLAFIVLKAGEDKSGGAATALTSDLVQLMRQQIGPVAALKTVLVVQGLPKTRSGKILRGTLKSIADGKDYKVTPTIESLDPLVAITEQLTQLGYGKKK